MNSEQTPSKALVTGATGGLGMEVIKRLILEGYFVQGLCSRVESIRNTMANKGFIHNAICLGKMRLDSLDLKYPLMIARDLEDIVGSQQPFDLLVFSHGYKPSINSLERQSFYNLRSIIEVDVVATMAICKYILPYMTGGGSIVAISSFHAFGTYPHRVPYATAKSAICGMVRGLALEFAPKGIRVNAICPGQIEGPRTEEIRQHFLQERNVDVVELMRQRSPSRQLVDPKDIAETILWLTKIPSLTGQSIILDHGVSASYFYEPY